jgi:hypothetical protein
MKLLQRSRDARYQTCEELIKDLEAVMASQGAWISAMTLGKYMRELFADKITAWEAAMEHGTSLGDHVASTITSESMRNELRMTPPSAFTAQTPPPELAPDTVRPVLRSSHKGVWVGLAAGAAITGGIAWFAFGRSSSPTERAKPTPLEAAQPHLEAPPAPPPKPAPPPVEAPKPAPPVEAEAPPADKPATKPVVKRKPIVAVKPKPEPPKPEPPKPEPPPKDPTKDNKWDRNSLTLPK